MIRFTCECGRLLQAREEQSGKKIKCPACDQLSIVPEPEVVVVSEGDTPKSDRPRRERRIEEPRATSGKATAALILGLLACPCVIGNVLTGAPAIIFGAIALGDINKSGGRLGGKGLALTGIITGALGVFILAPLAVMIGLLFPTVEKVRQAEENVQAREMEQDNLQELAGAMLTFHDSHNHLPQAAAYRSKDGKPLLSWRVALLPHLKQEALYNKFHLDEPWDSPHNKALLPLLPRVFQQPGAADNGSGLTHYQVLVGPGTAFESTPMDPPQAGLQVGLTIPDDFEDGTSTTVLIVTAENAVPWTRPDDVKYEPEGPLPQFSQRFRTGFNVAMADGGVRLVRVAVTERTLRAAITRNDGQPLGPDW
jgi:hypothetical protein